MSSDSSTSTDGSRRRLPTNTFVDTGSAAWTDAGSFEQGETERPAVVVVRVSINDGERWLQEQISSGGRAPVAQSERRRADRMLDGDDAAAHLVGRAVVRETLAGGDEEATSISLSRDGQGRPFARGSHDDFNISHTGGWVVVAISSAEAVGRVGVDLERVGRRTSKPRQTRLAGEILDDRERAWLDRVSRERTDGEGRARREIYEAGLMHLWTVKEAVLKQTGRGLRQDPRAVGCQFRSGARPGVAGVSGYGEKYCAGEGAVTPNGEDLEGLCVRSFAIDEEHLGAVVYGTSAPVRFVAFNEWKRSMQSTISPE